jgi:hypothetical protein
MHNKKTNEDKGELPNPLFLPCIFLTFIFFSFILSFALIQDEKPRKSQQKRRKIVALQIGTIFTPPPSVQLSEHRMADLKERKMDERKMGTLFGIRAIRVIRGFSSFS